MLKYNILFCILILYGSINAQTWKTFENTEGSFSVLMPENTTLNNFENTVMYSSDIDSTIFLHLHFVKNMPTTSKSDDVLKLYAQFLLYTLPDSNLESIKKSTIKSQQSEEICISYS
jgi:hypothetical protein